MVNEKIVSYYKLCAVKTPENDPRPLLKNIKIDAIFTKRQIEFYMKDEGKLRDNIIGGRQKNNKIIVV